VAGLSVVKENARGFVRVVDATSRRCSYTVRSSKAHWSDCHEFKLPSQSSTRFSARGRGIFCRSENRTRVLYCTRGEPEPARDGSRERGTPRVFVDPVLGCHRVRAMRGHWPGRFEGPIPIGVCQSSGKRAHKA
jgi:hypothetical protein